MSGLPKKRNMLMSVKEIKKPPTPTPTDEDARIFEKPLKIEVEPTKPIDIPPPNKDRPKKEEVEPPKKEITQEDEQKMLVEENPAKYGIKPEPKIRLTKSGKPDKRYLKKTPEQLAKLKEAGKRGVATRKERARLRRLAKKEKAEKSGKIYLTKEDEERLKAKYPKKEITKPPKPVAKSVAPTNMSQEQFFTYMDRYREYEKKKKKKVNIAPKQQIRPEKPKAVAKPYNPYMDYFK